MPQRITPMSNLLLTAAAAVAAVLIAAFAPASRFWPAATPLPVVDLVEVPAGAFLYRLPGEFWRDGRLAAAPQITISLARPLLMMRHQVTTADYQRCVAANACLPLETEAGPDHAMVKVSWRDADAYAAWLSRRTGLSFRLPTDQEWAFAAGSRFQDDGATELAPPADPGRRVLALYDQDAGRDDGLDKALQPIGSFGANEHGLLDLAGNVWEWTDTCFARTTLDAGGEAVVNCGVRLVEGRHRTYLPDFIRDARAGGCAVGKPPSNIGFRLVRAS